MAGEDDVVGSASVVINPDLSHFEEDLKAKVTESTDGAGDSVTIDVDADTDDAKAKLDEIDAKADETGAKTETISVKTNADTSQLDEAETAAARLKKTVAELSQFRLRDDLWDNYIAKQSEAQEGTSLLTAAIEKIPDAPFFDEVLPIDRFIEAAGKARVGVDDFADKLDKAGISTDDFVTKVERTGVPLENVIAAMDDGSVKAKDFKTAFDFLASGFDDVGSEATDSGAAVRRLENVLQGMDVPLKGVTDELGSLGDALDHIGPSATRGSDDIGQLGNATRNASDAVGGESGGGGLVGIILALGAALVPIAGVATGVALSLASIGTAVGASVGAFALVALPVYHQVSNALTTISADQKAVQDATSASTKNTAIIKLHDDIAALNPEVATLVLQIENVRTTFNKWSAQFQPLVLQVFSDALKVVNPLLADLTPLVKAGGASLELLFTGIASALQQPDFKQFIDFLAQQAPAAILALLNTFEHFAGGISKMFEALAPFTALVEDGLVNLTAHFEAFASSNRFQEFVQYLIEATPKVAAFFDAVYLLVERLLTSLAPVGAIILVVVTKVLDVANAFIKATGPLAGFALTALGVGLVLGKLVSALEGPVKTIAGLGKAFLGLKEAAELSNFEKLAQFLGTPFRAALSGAGGLIEALVGNLANLGRAFLNIGSTLATNIWSGVISNLQNLRNGLSLAIDSAVNFGERIGSAIAGTLQNVGRALQDAASAAAEFGRRLATAIGSGLSAAVDKIGDFTTSIYLNIAALGEWAAGLIGVEIESIALNAALGVGVIGAVILLSAAIYEMVQHFGVLRTIMAVSVAGVLALAVAFTVLDAVPIVAVIAGIALALAGLVAGIIYVATHWSEVWGEIKRVVEDAVNFIKSHLALVAVFAPWLAAIVLVATHWKEIWTGIKDVVTDAINWIRSHLNIVSIFAPFLATIIEIATHWSETWHIITDVTTTAVHAVEDEVKGLRDAIDGAFHLIEEGVQVLVSAWAAEFHLLGTIASDAIRGVVVVFGWIKTGFDDLVGWIRTGVSDAANAFDSLQHAILAVLSGASHWLVGIGKDIIQGLIDGIKSLINEPAKLIEGAAHNIIGIAKSVLGIFSPSTVFTEIGANTMQGLANGIKDNKALAASEMASLKLADALQPELAKLHTAAAGIGTELDDLAKGLYTLASVGDGIGKNIQPAVTAITDIGKAIGTLKNDTIPVGFSSSLTALGKIGSDIHPADIYQAFLLIAEGVKVLTPEIPQIDNLGKALQKLGTVRLPAGLGGDLSNLAKIGADLHPQQLYTSFLLIGEGLLYMGPKIPELGKLATAVANLSKQKLPDGLTNDLKSLATIGTSLHPQNLYDAFLFIAEGIRLVNPQINTLKNLALGIQALGQTKVSNAIIDELKNVVTQLDNAGNAMDRVKAKIPDLVSAFGGIKAKALDNLGVAISALAEFWNGDLTLMISETQTFASRLTAALRTIGIADFDSLKSEINAFRSSWNTTWEAIRQEVVTASTGISDTLDTIKGRAINPLSEATDAFKTSWAADWEAIRTSTANVYAGMAGTFGSIINNGLNPTKTAVNSLESSWVTAFSNMESALGTLGSRTASTLSGVASSLNALKANAASLPGALNGATAGVKVGATGGFITKPTLGLFGEAGPELLLPLSDPARMMLLLQSIALPLDAAGSATRPNVPTLPAVGSTLGSTSTGSAVTLVSPTYQFGDINVQGGQGNASPQVTGAAVSDQIQRALAQHTSDLLQLVEANR